MAPILCGRPIASWLCLLASVSLLLLGRFSTPGFAENIALGKSYTLVPESSWACGGAWEDFADYRQLTDGVYVPENTHIWNDVRGVGWNQRGKADITIDLGKVYPVSSVVLSAGCGRMRAYFPNLQVAVSDDGQEFTVVRTIDNKAASQQRRRVFRADGLATAARFVLIRIDIQRGRFAFLDEIQVFRGDHDPDAVKLSGATIRPLAVDERSEVQQQLARGLDRLDERARNSPLVPQAAMGIRKYKQLVNALPQTRHGKKRVVDPEVTELTTAKIRELYRKVAKQMYPQPELVVWALSPWEEVLPNEVPPPTEQLARVSITAGGNEHESAVLTLSNMSDSPRRVEVRLEGGLSGEEQWAGSVTIREPYFKTYSNGLVLADALPRLERPVEIPPWETRQIWLQVHTGRTTSGNYRGKIVLSGVGLSREIPLSVEVFPARIPDEVPVATYAWHWMGSLPAIQGIEVEAVKDLAAHYINVLYIHRSSFPWPEKNQIDFEGNISGSLDFTEADRMIELCKPISAKGLNLRLYWEHVALHLEPGTPGYRTRIQWLQRVIEHLRELGFDYKDLLLYPIDENIQTKFLRCGELIRGADPRAPIFGNPMATDWNEAAVRERADPYLDLWCPELNCIQSRRQVEAIQEQGEDVWSYRVFRRTSHPYAEYRLGLWNAFRLGVKGCGFWCYARGIDSKTEDFWQESPDGYAAIYTLAGAPDGVSRSEKIIPSRRWEAWREGVEDYTWLHMLRQLVSRRQTSGRNSPAMTQAAGVLSRAVPDVLEKPDNSRLADQYKREILEAITALL